ncbi:ROK family protein [Aeromicrobium sp. 636]|uniref:ROK family protein n=1 Tax=Aeromicrobium senzhongii TaxID=2663859 RepID=A0A8I0K2U7_9ACTN|nr:MULTISPECIES: ROK family protein [Aeromicrobium]MBC9226929.1 ROK family protein [Aeromicrobium senzhongii]MCQ3999029.1 ROK family protein [Aeromicrobium sp. 636]MTB89464.1 ROK family protein [Aeromicrobium senzhongii]QNL94399.1 ROK family protein [Aeromicrobium senzhongii]
MVMGFGIDIGGTGTKGAPVDLDAGRLVGDRFRIPTPQPATPRAVAEVAAQIVAHFPDTEEVPRIGVAIPAVVQRGVARSAANIDESWIDTDVDALFTEVLGREVHVVNDADAAGVAENDHGAAREEEGLVCVITLGTGIGSALISGGTLVPNTEFGHLEVAGHPNAEKWCATSAREREDLSWQEWAERLQVYFSHLERILSPDLFVVGGGVSKNSEKFLPLLDLRTPIVPAEHRNNAGIIGAAALGARG